MKLNEMVTTGAIADFSATSYLSKKKKKKRKKITEKVGDRVQITAVPDYYSGIGLNSIGSIRSIRGDTISMLWDNGSSSDITRDQYDYVVLEGAKASMKVQEQENLLSKEGRNLLKILTRDYQASNVDEFDINQLAKRIHFDITTAIDDLVNRNFAFRRGDKLYLVKARLDEQPKLVEYRVDPELADTDGDPLDLEDGCGDPDCPGCETCQDPYQDFVDDITLTYDMRRDAIVTGNTSKLYESE